MSIVINNTSNPASISCGPSNQDLMNFLLDQLICQIFIDLIFSIAIIVVNLLFLCKYLYQNELINVNLRTFLIAHVFCAIVNSVDRLIFVALNLWALIIDPCQVMKLAINCRFLSSPMFISYILILNLIIFISIERCIASYKFETYFDVKLYLFAILSILFGLIEACIVETRSLLSLKSYSYLVVCIIAGSVGESASLFNFLFLTVVTLICALLIFYNKLWNGWMLKKFDWYNQVRFNLRSRFQLNNNIEVNGSIFMMVLWFFVTVMILVVLAVYIRLAYSNQRIAVETVQGFLRLTVFVQQIYLLFYVPAYFMGSVNFRQRAVEKMVKWCGVLRSKFFHPKVAPAKQTAVLDNATKKYFQELQDLWGNSG